ncbi:response regulator [Lysobacter korlensis]|uniref:Response regulator n=1 Tax=Lysobacter korlensis TaxID=553636 RepID=A0ABV6RP77_9GAMM
MESMPPLRIVLVDDHPIVRTGFRQLLDMESDLEVAAEAGTAKELAALMLTTSFDLLILDLSLPDGDGLVMIRHLLAQRPGLPIVVLSMHSGPLYMHEARSAGARAFVSKSSHPEEILLAIQAVRRGESYFGSDDNSRDSAPQSDSLLAEVPQLTQREAQVLLLLARGHSVARVASTIGINPKTAYAHRASIYNKLGFSSDLALRKFAIQRGLIEPD